MPLQFCPYTRYFPKLVGGQVKAISVTYNARRGVWVNALHFPGIGIGKAESFSSEAVALAEGLAALSSYDASPLICEPSGGVLVDA